MVPRQKQRSGASARMRCGLRTVEEGAEVGKAIQREHCNSCGREPRSRVKRGCSPRLRVS
eukprot:4586516-Alexandrium_andersonii.AAC.1